MCRCTDAMGDSSTCGTYGGPTSVRALGHSLWQGLEYDLLGGETKCHGGWLLTEAQHSSAQLCSLGKGHLCGAMTL